MEEDLDRATLTAIQAALPGDSPDGHDLLHALTANSTGAWLASKGIELTAGAAPSPSQIVAIARAVCAAIGPVCAIVNEMPSS